MLRIYKKQINLIQSPLQKKEGKINFAKFFARRKILILSLIFLVFITPIVYSNLRTGKKVEAGWWNETWLYRKAVNITNGSGSNLTNFQVSFTLDTASLISAGKMQSDCDDIRITDIGGNLLPHWVEENSPGCNNSATKIWTKVSSLPTSGATIYVYYGNSSASNVESGDDVFEFFDDFSSANTNKFSYGEAYGGFNPIFYAIENGTLKEYSDGSSWRILRMKKNFSPSENIIVATRFKTSSTSNWHTNYLVQYNNVDYQRLGLQDQNNLNFRVQKWVNGSSSYPQNMFTASTNTWYKSEVIKKSATTLQIKTYNDDWSLTNSYETTESAWQNTTWTWVNWQRENVNVYYDWIFVRKYASTEPSASLGSEEQSQGPVAYWKLDEGTGSTAYDSAGTNNGSLGTGSSAPGWQTEELCMVGKCLKFDGTDDYVGIGSTANDIKTVSFWVKPNTNTTGLIGLSTSSYISVSSGTISATGFTSPTIYVNGRQSTTLETNKWQHIVVTTNTGITGSAITLGKASSSFLQGFLDEVKIYNYARTPAQIKADYNAGKAKVSSSKGAAVVMGSPDKGINLSEGLVGYWKMDESSGNPTDASGNNLTLTNNGSTTFVAGKFGDGSEHVPASSQYFSTTTTISGVKTISFWVNPDSNTNYYIELNGSAYIQSSSGTISAQGFTNPAIYVNGQLSTTITADTWSLITLVTDTAIDASSFKIGKIGGNYFDGTLDEVRLYNRALSPAEVRALYEWAPGPVAHFKLDDGVGTSPIDSSAFGRTSSIINALWGTGKFSKGLKLDGSGDYLEINDF